MPGPVSSGRSKRTRGEVGAEKACFYCGLHLPQAMILKAHENLCKRDFMAYAVWATPSPSKSKTARTDIHPTGPEMDLNEKFSNISQVCDGVKDEMYNSDDDRPSIIDCDDEVDLEVVSELNFQRLQPSKDENAHDDKDASSKPCSDWSLHEAIDNSICTSNTPAKSENFYPPQSQSTPFPSVISLDSTIEVDEVEKTADKIIDVDDENNQEVIVDESSIDIDQLLESDDEDSDGPKSSKEKAFAVDDIVWELWYHKKTGKGRVLDKDLVPGSVNNVIAQLCVITKVVKSATGRVHSLCLVPVSAMRSGIRQQEHTVQTKFVRRWASLMENRRIRDSQASRKDYAAFLSGVDTVERFLTNHVGLGSVPREEVKTAEQFFSLDSLERCIYLEGLRRMKAGLPKEIPRRNEESFDRSLEKEGVFNHIKLRESKDLEIETVLVQPHNSSFDESDDEDFLETLDEEMVSLTSELPAAWPHDVVKSINERRKLVKIITGKKRSRRHELFLDAKQRNLRKEIPELVKISNPSFMNIFGRKREALDRDVRLEILDNILLKNGLLRKGTEPRLATLLGGQAGSMPWLCREYVELVLYPHLFISWVGRVRGCTEVVADSWYQKVGTIISQRQRDLILHKHQQNATDSDTESSC